MELTARRYGGQGGQAVTEYLLILVVTIAVIFGAVYQFNDAFRVWANNYFGDYLSCLLETGELPALGGTGGQASSCNEIFKKFSLADGRPYAGSAAGSGSDSGQGQGKRPSNAVSEGSSTAGYVRASGNFGSEFGSDSVFGSPGGAGGGRGGQTHGNGNAYTGSTEGLDVGGFSSSAAGEDGGRRRFRLPDGFFSAGAKDQDEQRKPIKVGPAKGGPHPGAVRIPVNRVTASQPPPPDEPMTFGDFFRILIMAALIIALLLLVGTQLFRISKELK